MTSEAFIEFTNTHSKARLTEHEREKIIELADKLSDDLRQKIADDITFDWGGILARQPLTLKSLMQFLRVELLQIVNEKAKKTKLTGAPRDWIPYEQNRWLIAHWWKQEMQKLPEWARNLSFSDSEKDRV